MTPLCLLVFALLCSAPVRGQLDVDVNALVDVLGDFLVALGVDLEAGSSGGEESSEDDSGGGDDLLDLAADVIVDDLLDVDLDVGLGLGGGGDDGGDDGGESCGGDDGGGSCYDVDTIDRSLNDVYCEQPYFLTFVTKTDENCLIDNVCYTVFPLPDDPYTFNVYRATVFCDGSSRVETAIGTDISIGKARIADPFCTVTSNCIGYAGCDTYVLYRCMEFGDCVDNSYVNILGLSPTCLPLGLSCLQKVEEIVENAGLPAQEYFILPMKLPNRCVTEQICVNNIQGNFFRALNLPPPVAPAILV